MYFSGIDELKSHATSIPIAYDVAAIIGSVFIGYIFSKIKNKGLPMIPFMIILVVCFFMEKFVKFHLVSEFIVIGVIGFCLGGIFNTLSGLVVVELTKTLPEQKNKSKSISFLSALTMSIANFATAVTQLVIGFIIGKKSILFFTLDSNNIFVLFMVYAAVGLIFLIFVSIISAFKKTD